MHTEGGVCLYVCVCVCVCRGGGGGVYGPLRMPCVEEGG